MRSQIQRSAFVSGAGISSSSLLESSLGELMVKTVSASSSILTQGFIQNDQASLYTGLPAYEILLGKAYPNPVSSDLTIEIDGDKYKEMRVNLMNVLGEPLNVEMQNLSIGNKKILKLNLESLSPGIYFVKVISFTDHLTQVFKITKA